MEEKKVSIIVPVYKVEPYLNRCVNSLIKQTYHNLEIILVDDGSPDNSPKMCDDWAKKDNRIRVIHKINGGLSSARNAGLDIATGDYIAFADSDDYIDVKMIETMLYAALNNAVPVVCCGRVRVSDSSAVNMFNLPEEKIMTGEQAIKELLIGGKVEEAAWDKLYKADVFKTRRFPVGEINEDIVQTIEILGSCHRIVHVGKPLYYYCKNEGSITKSGYHNRNCIVIKHLEEIKEYIENYYPILIKYFTVLETRYCQSMLYLLLDNGETKRKNHQDYEIFIKKFKHGFSKRYVRNFFNKQEAAKGWLLFFHIYYPLRKMKKKVNK